MDMLTDRACLQHLAEALFGASLAATGTSLPMGATEAVLGAAALLSRLSERRRGQADAAMRRALAAVEAEWEAWGRHSSHADAGARESAKAAFETVAPHIAFTRAEVAGRNLDPEAIARAVLARAAAAKPDLYRDPSPHNTDHHLARQFLHRLTERAYRALIAEPGYMEEIAPALWREALERLGEIKDDTEAIRREQGRQAEDLEQVKEMLRRLEEGGQAQTARESGIMDQALVELARRITADVTSPEQAMTELRAAVDQAVRIQEEGRQRSNLGAVVEDALRLTAARSAKGEFDAVSDDLDAAIAEVDAQARAARTRLLDRHIANDRLSRDPTSAARHIEEMVRQHPSSDVLASLVATQRTWFDRGDATGLNFDLDVSMALGARILALGQSADHIGPAHELRGHALTVLAWRRGDPRLYLQAVCEFDAALQMASLLDVGGRRSWVRLAAERELTRYEFARSSGDLPGMQAWVEALEVLQDVAIDMPDLWIGIQTNMGTAHTETAALLKASGENDERRGWHLMEAVRCYQVVLHVKPRTKGAKGSALIAHNLGRTLMDLNRYEEARFYMDLALRDRRRETDPPRWAMTVHNLADLYHRMAAMDGKLSHVTEGLRIAGEALEVRGRKRSKVEWAMTMQVIGTLYGVRGQITGDAADLDLARDHVGKAVTVFSATGHDAYAEDGRRYLAGIPVLRP